MMGTCQDREPLEGFLPVKSVEYIIKMAVTTSLTENPWFPLIQKMVRREKCQSRMSANKGKSHVLENHFAKSGQCKLDEQNIYIVFTHY